MCGNLDMASDARIRRPDLLAITHVDVVPMDRPVIWHDQTVLVRHGVIEAVARAGSIAVSADAFEIDGRGLHLIPGLADMHVHLGAEVPGMGVTRPDALEAPVAGPEWDFAINRELQMYLANGVTAVRNMAGSPTTLHWMRQIEAGDVLGPRIFTASPIVDGTPRSVAHSAANEFSTPDEAPAFVADLQRRGYQFLKVYNQLSASSYHALVDAARAIGMPVIGHVPFSVGIEGAIAAHQDSVEHLRGYDFDPARPPRESLSVERFKSWMDVTDSCMRRYAEMTADAGIYNCPTLAIVHDGLNPACQCARAARAEIALMPKPLRDFSLGDFVPDHIAEALHSTVSQQMKMIKILHEADAKILAGTDTPAATMVPGFELHREIELLVLAGLSTFEALKSATVNAHEFLETRLGLAPRNGIVRKGYEANLVLLRGNPLEDISNTRRIEGVITQGRWFPFPALKLRALA